MREEQGGGPEARRKIETDGEYPRHPVLAGPEGEDNGGQLGSHN